jgi:hypothetical protein
MRRIPIVLVLLVVVVGWPTGPAFAQGSRVAEAPPASGLRGDFDNDGFEDLAIGVPFEDVGSVDDAGAVNVLYGSANKLTGVGSQLFTQDAAGVGSTAEDGDVFGGALAVGDFNTDGFADLAVGAPGESVGNVPGAGAINVLYGSANGLTGAGSQLFTQDSPGIGSTAEAVDSFGGALAVGDLDTDGIDDLVIGVPSESVGFIEAAGAINVLYGSAAKLTGAGSQLFTQDTPGIGSAAEAFDVFGQVLAVGDFNSDGADDLAVAARLESVGLVEAAGAVNVLYGSANGLTGAGSQLFTQDTPGVGSTAERADNFGFALAAGDFNADGFTDLAVGAPTETVGAVEAAGAINVLYGSAAKLTGAGSQLFTQDIPGVVSTVEERDDFGFALAAGDFDTDGADDLAVAAPAEDVGTIADAGAVNVLYGSATKLTGAGSRLFTQDVPGIGSTVEEGDSFGFALATGDFNSNGFADLAVGAPTETVGTIELAGAVNVLYGSATKLTGAGSQLFTQDVPGIGSTVEAFDTFGSAFGASASDARCCLI